MAQTSAKESIRAAALHIAPTVSWPSTLEIMASLVPGSSRPVEQARRRAAANWLLGAGLPGAPFLIAGIAKIVYDIAIYRIFRRVPWPTNSRGRA